MSFVADVVDAAGRSRLALVAIGADGERREIAFGEVADRSARLAGALAERGVARGDVVMTVVGNRPEWAYAMLACWRLGAVAQPCTEQLRPADLRARMETVEPRAVVADARDLELVAAAGFDGPVLAVPDEALFEATPLAASECAPEEPALIVFTSGTRRRAEARPPWARLPVWPASPGRALVRRASGRPVLVHRGQRLVAVRAQRVRGRMAARCRSAPPRRPLRPGRAARAGGARARERALHVPHRVPRDREARGAAAAARRCATPVPRASRSTPRWSGPGRRRPAWRSTTATARPRPATSPACRSGRRCGPARWAGPLPGFRAWIDDGELVVDPATVPTFFLDGARDQPWRTGDRVREDEDGYLWFEGRTDDVIISAGYRIGPFEVESALVSHPAVAEAAAVAAPDELRGQVVRAVVVLRDGYEPADGAGARAPGAREVRDGPVQVPAHRGLRGRPSRRRRAGRSSARS